MSKFNYFKTILLGVLFVLFSTGNVHARDNTLVDGVQQGRTVALTVTDINSEPLIGVNVLVKGTRNGGITDPDGKIQIQNITANSILVVSYIGYVTQEVLVGDQTTLSITLIEDMQALEEVVVVGYGVQKRSQVTGSISTVKTEDFENRSFSDPAQALQGKASGVQIFLSSGAPGTSATVRVRGTGSNASNDPLFVVDGRQVADISFLDSNDILSVEILKDASAASIYGARAGNGVVLITTKQGEKGATGKIEYRFMQSWQTNNNIPTVLNAQEYYDYQMKLNPANQSALEADWGNKTTDTDWLGLIFGTGRLSRHTVSMSGGQNNLSYYISGSANTNDGPIIGTKDQFKRYTATLNGNYQVKKWLQIVTSNNFTVSKTNGFESFSDIFGSSMRFTPLISPTVSEPTDYMNEYIGRGYMLIQDKDGNYPTLPVFPMSANINPLITLNRTNGWEKRTRISGTTSLILNPIDGLTYTSRLGYIFSAERRYLQTLPGVRDSQSFFYNQTVDARSEGSEEYQWENFASYTKSFGKHNTEFLAGMSYIQSQFMDIRSSVYGTGTEIGFSNIDPLYAYRAYASGGFNQTWTGGEENTARRLAYYGRINYNYDNKYLFQAVFRADAADLSQLPQSGRWGYFPAFSAGWTISNEDFMKDIKLISHLKLRASWGQTGTTAGLTEYAWQSVIGSSSNYSFIPGVMTYYSGKIPTTAGNLGLKWETNETLDLGFDLRLLQNRFTFTYGWYQRTTRDLILRNIVPSYIMGVTASPFNAGIVYNRGHEFELGWRDNVSKDFRYSVNGTFSTLNNKVHKITAAISSIAGASQDSHTITWFEEGYPMWHFKTYQYTGVDANGNPTFFDLNNNGVIDPDDKVPCGSGLPTFTFGLTITANYKNFDLSVFGAGHGGNKVFQTLTRAFQLQSNVPAYLLKDAWTEDNRNTHIPKIGMSDVGYYYVSSSQLFKGDYFKIKQLQIGYTLPLDLMRKISIENLRIYASCENMLTITAYPGFDPEIMNSGNNIGIDAGRYPANRNFILGVNLTF